MTKSCIIEQLRQDTTSLNSLPLDIWLEVYRYLSIDDFLSIYDLVAIGLLSAHIGVVVTEATFKHITKLISHSIPQMDIAIRSNGHHLGNHIHSPSSNDFICTRAGESPLLLYRPHVQRAAFGKSLKCWPDSRSYKLYGKIQDSQAVRYCPEVYGEQPLEPCCARLIWTSRSNRISQDGETLELQYGTQGWEDDPVVTEQNLRYYRSRFVKQTSSFEHALWVGKNIKCDLPRSWFRFLDSQVQIEANFVKEGWTDGNAQPTLSTEASEAEWYRLVTLALKVENLVIPRWESIQPLCPLTAASLQRDQEKDCREEAWCRI